MSLRDKLLLRMEDAEASGKALDVSNLRDDGTGSRMTNYPTTDRSTKYHIEGLPIMSNNYDTYKFVIDILGPEYDNFSRAYYNNYVRKSRSRSQDRSMSPSNTNLSDKFAMQLEKAEANGKVLDVSNVRDDGAGAKIVDYPKTDRSNKKHIEGLGIISDNYDAYKFVTDHLGNSYRIFSQTYYNNYVRGKSPVRPRYRSISPEREETRARSPIRPRSRSPVPLPLIQTETRARSPVRHRPRYRSISPVREEPRTRSRSPVRSNERFDIRYNV
jgi:hypothetical protein